MSFNNESRYLRRTATPYIGQSLIIFAVTVSVLVVSAKTGEWTITVSIPVMLAPFFYLAWLGLKYKIRWTTEEVSQQASGGATVTIKFSDIASVVVERSKPSEMFAMSRPFRRVAIYGLRTPEQKFIDISVRHFNLDDIRDLLETIGKHRPDLGVSSALV